LQPSGKFTADEHRERARQCVRMARQISDTASKTLLLDIAQLWIKLAEILETFQRKSGNGSADT
jgi:hypothetical protein